MYERDICAPRQPQGESERQRPHVAGLQIEALLPDLHPLPPSSTSEKTTVFATGHASSNHPADARSQHLVFESVAKILGQEARAASPSYVVLIHKRKRLIRVLWKVAPRGARFPCVVRAETVMRVKRCGLRGWMEPIARRAGLRFNSVFARDSESTQALLPRYLCPFRAHQRCVLTDCMQRFKAATKLNALLCGLIFPGDQDFVSRGLEPRRRSFHAWRLLVAEFASFNKHFQAETETETRRKRSQLLEMNCRGPHSLHSKRLFCEEKRPCWSGRACECCIAKATRGSVEQATNHGSTCLCAGWATLMSASCC